MQIDILTIFPNMFSPVLQESILKRAQEKLLVSIKIHNLRNWTKDKHQTTDDRPFGGGPGMVMKPEPIFDAVEELRGKFKVQSSKLKVQNYRTRNSKLETRVPAEASAKEGNLKLETKVVLLTPKGRLFNQTIAEQYVKIDQLILICGRYEEVDQRVCDYLADEELSVGEYVLTGGELPAMVVVDAVTRLIPGVLGNPQSLEHESFHQQTGDQRNNETTKQRNNHVVIYDYPQYTYPREMKWGKKFLSVPEVLLSGNHEEIAKWRREMSSKQ